jgi:ABC-2 type transport system permease protein
MNPAHAPRGAAFREATPGAGAWLAKLRTTSWLGWQVESNWADPFVFVVYSVARPLATALILTGMYWAVRGPAVRESTFVGFYLANAFHNYVTTVLVGMGWIVVEEREEYETLKYVYVSPVGIFTYLWGRSSVKLTLATVSTLLTLAVGWLALGMRWDWSAVRWLPLALALPLGLVACVYLGFLIAGWGLVLPRVAMAVNEGVAAALYLLCGVIFPIDLLPHGLRELSLALPFTYWYEALRRFVLGHGASAALGAWSDGALLGTLATSTVVFALISRWGYFALERHARRLGRLDQTTMF